MKNLILGLIVLSQAFANLCQVNFKPGFYEDLIIGSHVQLYIEKVGTIIDASFMGRIISYGGDNLHYVFYDANTGLTHVVDSLQVNLKSNPTGEGDFIQRLDEIGTKSIVQVSTQGPIGTCLAHTYFNCIMNLDISGNLDHDAKYYKNLKTERARLELLGRVTHDLYDGQNYQMHDLRDFAQNTLGLQIYGHDEANAKKFINEVTEHVRMGWPVILTYDIGPNMVLPNNRVMVNFETKVSQHRLWLPRKQGEGSAGRHGVLIIGDIVDTYNNQYFMVLDPNHSHPVLWSKSELKHHHSSRFEAVTIWE
jgi:hypothetical protein